MRVRYAFPSISTRREVAGDRAFLLRNQLGDSLSFFTTPQSRYEGWLVRRDNRFLKLLERVEVLDDAGRPAAPQGVTLTGQTAFWDYADGSSLGWRLLPTRSGLILRASRPLRLRLSLDVRDLYALPEFGRSHQVEQQAGTLLVRYQGDGWSRPVFLHLRGNAEFLLDGEWLPQDYPRDRSRNSQPDQRYVYRLAVVTTDRLAVGFGETPEEARAVSLAASRQRYSEPLSGPSYAIDTLMTEVTAARVCAAQSLRWLQTENGLWAGLPWFDQVWTRDELITALGLDRLQQREVINRYLGHPLRHGELPTLAGTEATCADGVGWLCLLVRAHGERDLPAETHERLVHFLRTAHGQLGRHRLSRHGLVHAAANATWMDTAGRAGYPLEIQCMYGLLLELLFSLTGEEGYEQERLRLLGTIRQFYWTSGYLRDSLDDLAKRPNVFLAYLCQPDLLSQELWQRCFDTVLEAVRLPWGGLSSLDQGDRRFQASSTGEDNRSYHQGDSWFFLNNLAAVAMQRLNHHRYGKVITGILESSTEEILWKHLLGRPGEIASAASGDSWGCGCQAFSAGTYLLLLEELEGYSSAQDRDTAAFFWDSAEDSTAFAAAR